MGSDYIPVNGMRIFQEKGVFSFSMDSVLLAAYGTAKGRVLDLGCGSGYLALMAVEASDEVVAVDKSAEATALVEKSAAANGVAIETVTGDFRTLELSPFDVIFTNPPFYRESMKNADASVAAAKHLEKGMRWFYEAARLLKPGGRIYGIVDVARFQEVMADLSAGGVAVKRMRPVYWKEGEAARRVLFEGVFGGGCFMTLEPALVIYKEGTYSEEVASYYGR
ncbi:MAG: methyltransferase [Peptoniphilus sp.]|nr:methyltransferase [Peptoniphilus sp.]MDY3118953.1 methyltransferase [Peptoniphilus sp.]